MQRMGQSTSKNEAASVPPPQQRAAKTPTVIESQDSHITGDIPWESDDESDTKAAPVCNTEAKEAKKKVPEKPPHNYEDILKDADEDFHIDDSSIESLYNQLYDGVFLNQKRQKYWVDKETGSNCFMLYARELSITWIDNDQYWSWSSHPETSDVSVEVAELILVCWLEIHAKFDTTKLTPGTLYQVAFIIKMDHSPTGWNKRVNLKLKCPDGTTQENEENFARQTKEQWIEIPVGKFQVSPQDTKELEVSMLETHGGKWKTGLSVKGVIIQPKKNNAPV